MVKYCEVDVVRTKSNVIDSLKCNRSMPKNKIRECIVLRNQSFHVIMYVWHTEQGNETRESIYGLRNLLHSIASTKKRNGVSAKEVNKA